MAMSQPRAASAFDVPSMRTRERPLPFAAAVAAFSASREPIVTE
jgi:hypothetical protein